MDGAQVLFTRWPCLPLAPQRPVERDLGVDRHGLAGQFRLQPILTSRAHRTDVGACPSAASISCRPTPARFCGKGCRVRFKPRTSHQRRIAGRAIPVTMLAPLPAEPERPLRGDAGESR